MGMKLEFPQTPRSVIVNIVACLRCGGQESRRLGAIPYPATNPQALIHLKNVAQELGITELCAHAIKDIDMLGHCLVCEATRRQGRFRDDASPEVLTIIAEYEGKIY